MDILIWKNRNRNKHYHHQQQPSLPKPDRDCFHPVLSGCVKSKDESFSTAKEVLHMMMKPTAKHK
jgi:hypothetical protein